MNVNKAFTRKIDLFKIFRETELGSKKGLDLIKPDSIIADYRNTVYEKQNLLSLGKKFVKSIDL